jgi:hypothetical protein
MEARQQAPNRKGFVQEDQGRIAAKPGASANSTPSESRPGA